MRIVEGIDDRDGLSRIGTLEFEEKKLSLPNYCVPITKSPKINGLELRLRAYSLTKGHTGSYVLRTHDFDKILHDGIISMDQTMLDGRYQFHAFRTFFKQDLFILDQSSESLLYFKYLERVRTSSRIPIEARTFADDLSSAIDSANLNERQKAQKYDRFWEGLSGDRRRLARFLGQSFDFSNETFADIILPFTIVIESRATFEIAREINKLWKAQCELNGKRSVAYLLMKKAVLRNPNLITEIIDYLKNLQVDVIVIKIKNLDLTAARDVQPRELYTQLLQAIAEIKRKNNQILTIALESGDQFFANATRAFDIVSRSMHGNDEESESTGGADVPVYGGALELDEMVSLPFSYWEAGFARSGTMPCPHDYCHENITTLDKHLYSDRQWNIDRRIHNMFIMDEWLKQIADAVLSRQADLIPQKLHNSQLRILEELIPRRI